MNFPYESAAWDGLEIPDGLDAVDQWMFLSLRLLYQSYKKGVISKEMGNIEKGKLAHERTKMENKFKIRERIVQSSVEMTVKAESAANAYAKERTLENADRLYEALYGMIPKSGGDSNRQETN